MTIAFVVLIAITGIPREGLSSKFTHPLRAFVTLSKVKAIRSADALKKHTPRKSAYEWVEPAIDGNTVCAYVGTVAKVTRVVDAWKLVDLKKRLRRKTVVVSGPCSLRIDKGSALAEVLFAPRYDNKSPMIVATRATGNIIIAKKRLTLAVGKEATFKGYTLKLTTVGVAEMESSKARPDMAFDMELVVTKAKQEHRGRFYLESNVRPAKADIHRVLQDAGPFTVFVRDFNVRNQKLRSVTLEFLMKSH